MIKIERGCSFYVSDWHLITMILPHINKAINEEVKVATILEEDSSDKIQMLLSKLRLKNERQILRINWKNTNKPEKEIYDILKNNGNSNIEIIICGSNKYIEIANNEINNFAEKNGKAEMNIKIIDCYNIENVNMRDILTTHTFILNTAGEQSKDKYLEKIIK